jgi:nitrile hydratase subunit beta
MNGIHDMGGMHGMGPIRYEKDEPVFHQRWEARTFALTRALRVQFGDKSNLDASRHALEQLAPGDYLRMTYYEKWFVRLFDQVVNQGLVTQGEISSGKSTSGSRQFRPVLTADIVPAMIARGNSARRDVRIDARFAAGQRVRARNMNPTGHTRLPRYARGKLGTIVRDHGVFVFPDTRAHFQGDKSQHVYSVRFDARELWGGNAKPHDAVYVDLWEDYLEPA